MKFAAVFLTRLAVAAAVSALPTLQAQDASEVFTRSDGDALFVRYSDSISYLDARAQSGSSNNGTAPKVSGGDGGDVGSQSSLPSYHHGQNDPAPGYIGSTQPAPDFRSAWDPNQAQYAGDTKTPTGHNRRELVARGNPRESVSRSRGP